MTSSQARLQFLLGNLTNDTSYVAISQGGSPKPIAVVRIAEILQRHLSSNAKDSARVGIYAPNRSQKTKWVVYDFDGGTEHKHPLKDPRAAAVDVANKLKVLGLSCNLELSKSGLGYHLWVLFDDFVSAKSLRRVLYKFCEEKYELANGGFANPHLNQGIEFFPKQDLIDPEKGFGNLVYLPWYGLARSGCNEFVSFESDDVVLQPCELLINSSRRIHELLDADVDETKNIPRRMHLAKGQSPAKKDIRGLDIIKDLCPAVNHIFDELKAEMPSHTIRRTAAQTLISFGLSIEEMLPFFSHIANFDTYTTAKQIESIMRFHIYPGCNSLSQNFSKCNGCCVAAKRARAKTPINLVAWEYVGVGGNNE